MPNKMVPPPVVVAGMHRSGTSLVASLLSALSVDMGGRTLLADSNNVRGYFEDLDFLHLQRKILNACCAADDGGHPDWGWTEHETLDPACFGKFIPEASALISDRSDRSSSWGWKDPRTTLLLDFWNDLLDDARYVLVYRFPWDVADSMQRLGAEVFLRNPEYAYKIWHFYNRHILDFYSRNSERSILISTNALSGNHPEFTRLISAKLGIDVSGAALEDIHSKDLFKITGDCDPLIDLVAAVWPQCTELFSQLDEVADLPAQGLWRARPVRSRLARPDQTLESKSIDLSVVTPCYNQGVFLVDAIASVERFAPPNCELVIVNDGSTDARTLEIFDVLRRSGYFILDQPNLGLSAARNAGIALARGRYSLPLDDDNRIRTNFIQDSIQVLDAYPEVGIVYGDRHEFGLRLRDCKIPDFDLINTLQVNYIDACAVFRKRVWEDCGGYDAEMSPMEDWELWVHAAARSWQFYHLPYITLDYRVRPGSLLSKFQSIDAPREFRKRIVDKHHGLSIDIAGLFDHINLLSSELRGQQEGVRILTANLETAKDQILQRDKAVQTLTSESEAYKKNSEEQIARLSHRLADREAELTKIKASRGWKLLEWYGRIKYRHLLPVYKLLGLRKHWQPPS